MSPDITEAFDATNTRFINRVLGYLPEQGDFHTAVGGLTLFRREQMHIAENCFYQPIIALTLQGRKRSIIGTEEYRYGAKHCLINGVDMPSLSYVTEASNEKAVHRGDFEYRQSADKPACDGNSQAQVSQGFGQGHGGIRCGSPHAGRILAASGTARKAGTDSLSWRR